MKHQPSVDIIIPSYKPGRYFAGLLRMLKRQSYPIGRLIIVNTEEGLWTKEAADAVALAASEPGSALYQKIELYHIPKEAFDHAGTRDFGVRHSDAEIFICMTDDAEPKDECLVERLVAAFDQNGAEAETEEKSSDRGIQDAAKTAGTGAENTEAHPLIAMAYARQLVREDCEEAERCTRLFNYPAEACVKTAKDIPALGIKAFFASNVCCAYRREVYDRLGGFSAPAIFNEDMIFAHAVIKAGYGIAYAAEAEVLHSHHYSARQQFHRNFDLGMSQAMHPEVFAGIPSEGEGIRMVRFVAKTLLREGKPLLVCGLFVKSAAKLLGYRLGKGYDKLPYRFAEAFAMNKSYVRMHLKKETFGRMEK